MVNQVVEALNDQCSSVKGARVLLLGLAYKANVDDDRESPSYALMGKLEARGAKVSYNDPFVPVIRGTREHSQFAGRESQPISDSYEVVLIATAHGEYLNMDFSGFTCAIVNTRRCVQNPPARYYQA